MLRLLWVLGFAGITPLACIKRPPGPEAAAQDQPQVASEADVKSLLDRAQQAADAERYAEARDLARRALELTETVRVAPRILATLHETEGMALWHLEDLDAQEAFETAAMLWEQIPGAERDIARVTRWLANTFVFPLIELERAERLLRRSIELTTKVDPTDTGGLFFAHHLLLEVLWQECRTTEALPLIEAADAIVKNQRPVDPWHTAAIHRIRANFAENAGDIPLAIEEEKRVLEEFARAESKVHVQGNMDLSLAILTQLERNRGNYEAMRTYVERRVELAGASPNLELALELALELYWAYLATRDPRLAEHAAKHSLVSAQVGAALFPKTLPTKGACRPEEKPYRGLMHRYRAVSERAEPCLKGRSKPSEGHPILITLRTVNGKVVAADAVGHLADPPVVRCIAEAALGYEHPIDKYSEFGWARLE